jgi:hypothetical protein
MNKHFYRFAPVLFVVLYGCLFPFHYNPDAQIWFYLKSNDGPPTFDTALSPVSFLDLRPDGGYTQDWGHFAFGTWKVKNHQLYLTDQHHRTYVYQANRAANSLSLVLGAGNRIGYFHSLGSPYNDTEKDPFSIDNNRWRIPPAHKETDQEIRKRLFNHCQFWEAYFSWAIDKGIGSLDVRNTPTPIKIYGNGFGLKHFDDLPSEWKACFFDEEDCHKADTLIKHTFRRNNIKWPETDDDMKKFVSAFQQLQDFLR